MSETLVSLVCPQNLFPLSVHVVLPVPSVTEPNHPLKLQESRSYFKLFMGDVGLLTCSYGLEALKRMLCDDLDISCGSLFENAVAQELMARGHDLHYYRSKGIGEVDFVLERGSGTVQLVQVKSGKSYKRHSALTKLLAREDHAIDSAVVLREDNLSVVDKVAYCPVYMAMCL